MLEKFRLFEQFVTQSMVFCDSVFCNSLSMFFCRVGHVFFPPVLWILHSESGHIIVPVCLCQYRCRRNGEVFTISLDYTGIWNVAVLVKSVTIYDNVLRAH